MIPSGRILQACNCVTEWLLNAQEDVNQNVRPGAHEQDCCADLARIQSAAWSRPRMRTCRNMNSNLCVVCQQDFRELGRIPEGQSQEVDPSKDIVECLSLKGICDQESWSLRTSFQSKDVWLDDWLHYEFGWLFASVPCCRQCIDIDTRRSERERKDASTNTTACMHNHAHLRTGKGDRTTQHLPTFRSPQTSDRRLYKLTKSYRYDI